MRWKRGQDKVEVEKQTAYDDIYTPTEGAEPTKNNH
jgi:hypothetical protein